MTPSKHRDCPHSSLAPQPQRAGADRRREPRARKTQGLATPQDTGLLNPTGRRAAPRHFKGSLCPQSELRVDDTLNTRREEEEEPAVPRTALVKPNGSRCSNQASLTPLIEAGAGSRDHKGH